MKVLFISTPAFADCDFPLIKEFQKKGIDITYLLLIAPFSLRSTLVDIKKIHNETGIFPCTVYEEFKPYEKYMNLERFLVSTRTGQKIYHLSTLRSLLALDKYLRNNKFDIVHCDTYFRGLSKYLYGMLQNVVTTFHDPIPHVGAEKWDTLKTRKIAVDGSKGLVLLNKRQLDEFCNQYNVDRKDILINRLGIYDNIKAFIYPNKTKEKKHNILFFGRITPYKGVEALCKAMMIVKKAVPNATLTIAGGGRFDFDINHYRNLGYIEIINHYIGMEQLSDLLFNCDFTVCPYTEATQSGVIMTSFALNKPVVATDVGALAEMVENGRTGVIVPPRDIQCLADAIIMLLTDDFKVQQMSKNIEEDFSTGEKSWSAIAEKYIEYYKQILEKIR